MLYPTYVLTVVVLFALYRTSVLAVVVLFAFTVIFMKFFYCHVTRFG